jgi:hypothetical protein
LSATRGSKSNARAAGGGKCSARMSGSACRRVRTQRTRQLVSRIASEHSLYLRSRGFVGLVLKEASFLRSSGAMRHARFWGLELTSFTEALGLARRLRASATQEEQGTKMKMSMTEWMRTCETVNRVAKMGCDEEQVARVARKCFLDAKRDEEREARRVARA